MDAENIIEMIRSREEEKRVTDAMKALVRISDREGLVEISNAMTREIGRYPVSQEYKRRCVLYREVAERMIMDMDYSASKRLAEGMLVVASGEWGRAAGVLTDLDVPGGSGYVVLPSSSDRRFRADITALIPIKEWADNYR